jgi:nitrous-oxide reductase
VTPNTEYVIEGGQYATVLGYGYAPIEEYKKSYRGMVTLWKFDRAKGRIDEANSFALELPPYWQDLSDSGKRASRRVLLHELVQLRDGDGWRREGPTAL